MAGIATVIATAALMMLTGCAGNAGSPGSSSPATSKGDSTNSGISGVALAGPQCPVEIAGSPCPPRPIAILVVVRDRDDREVATFQTAADGTFRVTLPPGRYTLSTADQPAPPFLKPVEVTVVEGSYVQVQLAVDTGIR